MSETLLAPILTTGFAVAFLHAALPTHWLPFVLAGRGQHWSRGKTLSITALAGLGHVLFTTLLGTIVVGLGIETSRWTGDVFPFLTGGALIAFGLYYLFRQMRGARGHSHWGLRPKHHHHDQDGVVVSSGPQAHHASHADHQSDRVAVLSLLALLTFSPCEAFLPVYLSGIAYGWAGFAALSLVLAIATLTGMVAFTGITLAGFERLRLSALERFESGMLGGALVFLGVAIIVFES
ncbi:hypothetical protein [Microvirga sp. Mcv34]|uniref:hypothetical protein n=1 Tax=Microvirga sp. Mcv34 TaxID=2926016 RepID=UPI0021C59591|nr:hypothetical protein [Microvirga sp. Mcv34]